MFKTKAEINQIIKIDNDELKTLLEHIDSNVYIINNNSGNIQTQENLSDCLMDLYRQGVGLLGVLERVKHLYISRALTDCKTQKQAALKLGVSTRTIVREKKQIGEGIHVLDDVLRVADEECI